jgi:hypothetical protein
VGKRTALQVPFMLWPESVRHGNDGLNSRTSQRRTMLLKPLESGNILLLTGKNRARKFNGVRISEAFKGDHLIT